MPLKNDNISNNVIVCFGFVFVLFFWGGGEVFWIQCQQYIKEKRKRGMFRGVTILLYGQTCTKLQFKHSESRVLLLLHRALTV